MDLTDICRIFHTAIPQYTFSSTAHGTSSITDHILSHKASLKDYKKIEITSCILSDHNTINLEFNNKRNSRRYQTSGG
jgi:hypothetical protein